MLLLYTKWSLKSCGVFCVDNIITYLEGKSWRKHIMVHSHRFFSQPKLLCGYIHTSFLQLRLGSRMACVPILAILCTNTYIWQNRNHNRPRNLGWEKSRCEGSIKVHLHLAIAMWLRCDSTITVISLWIFSATLSVVFACDCSAISLFTCPK